MNETRGLISGVPRDYNNVTIDPSSLIAVGLESDQRVQTSKVFTNRRIASVWLEKATSAPYNCSSYVVSSVEVVTAHKATPWYTTARCYVLCKDEKP